MLLLAVSSRGAFLVCGVVGLLAGCGEEPTAVSSPSPGPELAVAGSNTWTIKAPIPTYRTAMGGAVVQDALGRSLFFTIGGFNDNNPRAMRRVEAYNAATNTWSRKANLPADRSFVAAVAIGSKIYVVGGLGLDVVGGTKTLYVYNLTSNTWSRKADLPVTNLGRIAGVIGGKLYVLVETHNQSMFRIHRLYRYNPSTNVWTRLADPPNVHFHGAGGVIDGKLYAAWGSSPTVDVYDPSTNRWTTKLTFTYSSGGECHQDQGEDCSVHSPASTVLGKKLYTIGGQNDDEAMPHTIAYDPVANTWRHRAPMNFPREDWPTAGKVKNGAGQLQIIVVGGKAFAGEPMTQTEAYTP